MSYSLEELATITDDETFAVSAENPTGCRGGGKTDHPTEKSSAFRRVEPGQTLTVLEMDGPAELRSWWCGGYSGSEFILRIYWENQEYPSVEAPLCAFFGFPFNGVTLDYRDKFPVLNSIPVLVTAYKGMNCYWSMPFNKHCRITITNIGETPHQFYWIITGIHKAGVRKEPIAYFHASYRSVNQVEDGSTYTIIDGIRGQGHLVGVALGAEPVDATCWVEGEVKMFLDGETNASVNYTGTEDYFCGSYNFGADRLRRYHSFSGPYCGMYNISFRRDARIYAPNRFMAYRWHIPDPIHFRESLKVTIQNMGYTHDGSKVRGDHYVSMAYWYQTLPSQPLQPLPDAQTLILNDLP